MTEAVQQYDPVDLAKKAAMARKAATERKAEAEGENGSQPATYEALIAKARELDAAGNSEGAKRLAEIALKRRRLQLLQKQAQAKRAQQSQGESVIEVELPDGSIAEFPAGTPQEVMKSALQRKFASEKAQEPTAQGFDPSPSAFARRAALASGNDRNISEILKENLLGDDGPTTQNFGEKVGSFLNKAGESLSFGLVGDEASAAVESLAPGVSYEDRLNHYRQQEEQFASDHPVAALGAELVPLAIPGVGAMATAAKVVGMGARMLRGGAVAGGQGSVYGFAEGEGGFGDRGCSQGPLQALYRQGWGFAGPLRRQKTLKASQRM